MKPKGSDSSQRLWFDELSKHFSWDYPPVTGMLSWTLYNTDNIIGFLLWILAVPSKNTPNTFHYYLALCLCLQCTCQTELSPQYAALSGQATAEPLTAYLRESQQIAVYLCWFITPFHHLLDQHGSQNMTAPSLSLLPLPFHLFSPVAFDQTEEKSC